MVVAHRAEAGYLAHGDLLEVLVLLQQELAEIVLARDLFRVAFRVEIPLAPGSVFHAVIAHRKGSSPAFMEGAFSIGTLCLQWKKALLLSTTALVSAGRLDAVTLIVIETISKASNRFFS